MSELKDNIKHQKEILEKLYLIRDLEEAIAEQYSKGEMRCPTHLSIGQEGVPSALSVLLSHDDLAVSTHRSHAHYLAKGGCVKAMIAELFGKATGCSGGRGGSMHLIDENVGFKGSTAIVGNTIPIGVGLALSQKLRALPNISVVYVGDGAIEEGVFYEAANFAALKKLPVLFVCENNLYSVYSNLNKRQPSNRKIHEMVKAMGLNTFYGDGNDVVACYQLFSQIKNQMNTEGGPAFVELSTYRWREHCGPNYDNHIGYRSEEEFTQWKLQEPIARYEKWLEEHKLLSKKEMNALRLSISNRIEAAFDFARQSPFPDAATISDHIYAVEEKY